MNHHQSITTNHLKLTQDPNHSDPCPVLSSQQPEITGTFHLALCLRQAMGSFPLRMSVLEVPKKIGYFFQDVQQIMFLNFDGGTPMFNHQSSFSHQLSLVSPYFSGFQLFQLAVVERKHRPEFPGGMWGVFPHKNTWAPLNGEPHSFTWPDY